MGNLRANILSKVNGLFYKLFKNIYPKFSHLEYYGMPSSLSMRINFHLNLFLVVSLLNVQLARISLVVFF